MWYLIAEDRRTRLCIFRTEYRRYPYDKRKTQHFFHTADLGAFEEIDADVNKSVKEEGENLEEKTKTLEEVFRKVLNKDKLTVKAEKLKNENVSAMMTISEESRRMQEMMKMYNMYGMDPSMFGGQETLVLNVNNKLVQYVLENKDGENVPLLCEQLYDLAVISHRQLTPEEMTKFVARSNEIMMMMTK